MKKILFVAVVLIIVITALGIFIRGYTAFCYNRGFQDGLDASLELIKEKYDITEKQK